MADAFTVLFIVTPSADTARADRLVKSIGKELEDKGVRADFDLQQARATDVDTLTRELLSHLSKGNGIVHLCARVTESGFVFGEGPGAHTVDTGTLARAIDLTCSPVQVVALSDCFEAAAADGLAGIPSPVLGTLDGTDEPVTTSFFVGFYRGFAHEDDIAKAFGLGHVQVELQDLDPASCQLTFPPGAEPDALGRPTHAAPTPPTAVMHNLPPRNPAFTGRDTLLTAISDRLVAGDAAVTQAFEGMGGVGKTELAVEFAHRNLDAFAVVWWVACEEVEAIPGQLDQLAIRLGVPGENSGERLEHLDDHLAAHEPWLLIADNVEEWARVAPTLPHRGRGSRIITTRHRGQHLDAVDVDVFTEDEAHEFVARRLRQDEVDASALAQDLGRLPLALEQACSYILATGCSLDDYRRLFQDRHEELLALGETGSHEGTVAATFALSLEQAKQLAGASDHAVDPEPLATLCAFLASENIPISLLGQFGDG